MLRYRQSMIAADKRPFYASRTLYVTYGGHTSYGLLSTTFFSFKKIKTNFLKLFLNLCLSLENVLVTKYRFLIHHHRCFYPSEIENIYLLLYPQEDTVYSINRPNIEILVNSSSVINQSNKGYWEIK